MLVKIAVITCVLSARAVSADCGLTRRLLASTDDASIVLDDAAATGTGWHQGALNACLEDAYGGNYHTDKALNKGHVSAVYAFDPPKDGCYVIEEHHPGQNLHCSQRLPTNVRVDVDYCKGLAAYTHVDQSLAGGQWNILGALPFFVGWEGRIKVANNGTDSTCKLGSDCVWVMDAFKVTWVADLTKPCRVPSNYGAVEPTTTSTSTPATFTETVTTTSYEAVQAVAMQSTHSVAPAMNILQQAVEKMQTIVDDVKANSSTVWQRSTCGAQGWLQSFLYQVHMPGSRPEKGAEFEFDPPSDGCYLVEEFHPEDVCGQDLSTETSLSIHYCKGLKHHTQVDQSKNGNQWNTVGAYMFYKGILGKVVVAHPQIGAAAAAADAFRFTRISASCHDAVQASIHYHRLSQNAAAILVDNRHPQQSTSRTCGKKALGGSLHAASEGAAEAKFEFTPTSTGCYRVDSFHPEEDDTQGCVLADSAALEVNWCLGQQTKLMSPLKGKGNRWNMVGHFKFYAGSKGSVISRRASQSPDGKFWVADAFRFTKVSESCEAVPESGRFSFHISGKGLEGHVPSALETGMTSYSDMRMALHEAVVEATKLPYKAIQLLSIRKGSVIADFEVRGTKSDVLDAIATIRAQVATGSESALKQNLCNAVTSNAKGECDVAIIQVSEPTPDPPAQEESNEAMFLVLSIVGGTLAALTAVMLCAFACRRSTKKEEAQVDDSPAVHVIAKGLVVPEGKLSQKETSFEDGSLDAEKGKPSCDEVSLSGSTATPASDQDGLQDMDLQSQQSPSEV